MQQNSAVYTGILTTTLVLVSERSQLGDSSRWAQALPRVLECVRSYWGFTSLRPLQELAIRAAVEQRDSVVVLPTGGGKSLCYQVPPIVADRTDVVVSPLISLMKDQVDGLRECGYPAVGIHSGLSRAEKEESMRGLRGGECRLVFMSPERLLTPWFLGLVEQLNVSTFAIDEAHCISHWGHDFRPEYRKLAMLKERFPSASVHAYTATATERVRADIAAQLRLNSPAMLVGNFDRPNLTYRVVPRIDVYAQAIEAVRRHLGEGVIVYCLSRKDTEEMAASLRDAGVEARAYHAGLSADERRKTQDAFAAESLSVVTATVAFGMGIDRSNVRCVIHATMPKSIEHYQQETGRAGRDGLEAECVLFYSVADAMRWESLIERSAEDASAPAETIAAAKTLLDRMRGFCAAPSCRHRALSEYFGQEYAAQNCEACDVCLDETEGAEDGTDTAKKILSCVARIEQCSGTTFGVVHTVDVLLGAQTETIRRCRHDQLSTHGILKGEAKKTLTNWVYQLLDQGLLARSPGDRPVLRLNPASWEVMRGQRSVQFTPVSSRAVVETRHDAESWKGVDRGLFEHLRQVRRQLAERSGVPAFVIVGDRTLRDLARRRPTSEKGLRRIFGMGDAKIAKFGDLFLSEIRSFCGLPPADGGPSETESDDELELAGESDGGEDRAAVARRRQKRSARRMSPAKEQAFAMFAAGASVEHVAESVNRTQSTVSDYLAQFIAARKPASIDKWIDPSTYEAVANAAEVLGVERLKPIFERLKGTIPYDSIRLVTAHLGAMAGE